MIKYLAIGIAATAIGALVGEHNTAMAVCDKVHTLTGLDTRATTQCLVNWHGDWVTPETMFKEREE